MLVISITIYIYFNSKQEAKKGSLAYLLYRLTRFLMLIPMLNNYLSINIKFSYIIIFMSVLSVLSLIIYIIRKNNTALYYFIFNIIYLLFGTSPFFGSWLPFLYVVYLFYKEKSNKLQAKN